MLTPDRFLHVDIILRVEKFKSTTNISFALTFINKSPTEYMPSAYTPAMGVRHLRTKKGYLLFDTKLHPVVKSIYIYIYIYRLFWI